MSIIERVVCAKIYTWVGPHWLNGCMRRLGDIANGRFMYLPTHREKKNAASLIFGKFQLS